MFELIKESDLDTVRHFYRALAGTEFCAWTDIYPGEPELQSDFSRDSLFCIRDDVSGRSRGWFRSMMIRRWNRFRAGRKSCSRRQKFPDWVWRRSTRTEASHASFLAGAMEELRRRGCKSAHMLVAKDNVKALRSYAKLAFEKVGEYVLQGHDYWCFEKKL